MYICICHLFCFLQASYSYDAGSSFVNQPYYSQETETYTYTYPTGASAVAQAQGQQEETDLDLEKVITSSCQWYLCTHIVYTAFLTVKH